MPLKHPKVYLGIKLTAPHPSIQATNQRYNHHATVRFDNKLAAPPVFGWLVATVLGLLQVAGVVCTSASTFAVMLED